MADSQPQSMSGKVTDGLPYHSRSRNGSFSTNTTASTSFGNLENYDQSIQRQNSGGRRHVRQFSITSIANGEKRKSTDTTRFILLDKKAIDTIQKCSSITEYNNLAVHYLSQVS